MQIIVQSSRFILQAVKPRDVHMIISFLMSLILQYAHYLCWFITRRMTTGQEVHVYIWITLTELLFFTFIYIITQYNMHKLWRHLGITAALKYTIGINIWWHSYSIYSYRWNIECNSNIGLDFRRQLVLSSEISQHELKFILWCYVASRAQHREGSRVVTKGCKY